MYFLSICDKQILGCRFTHRYIQEVNCTCFHSQAVVWDRWCRGAAWAYRGSGRAGWSSFWCMLGCQPTWWTKRSCCWGAWWGPVEKTMTTHWWHHFYHFDFPTFLGLAYFICLYSRKVSLPSAFSPEALVLLHCCSMTLITSCWLWG